MLSDWKVVVKHVQLLAKANILANFIDFMFDRSAIDQRITGCHVEHASKHVDSCGFAGSIVAKDRHDFVSSDGDLPPLHL